jgi:hypothetical protein
VSASEIIKELPKLSDAERRAVLNKLRELSQLDDERWDELLNDPKPRPKLELSCANLLMKANLRSIQTDCEIVRTPELLARVRASRR